MTGENQDVPDPLHQGFLVRRGKDIAKSLGAIAALLAGLALAGHALWDFRGEWPVWLLSDRLGETAAVPAPVDPPLSSGRRIYESRCVNCHGPSGHGDGPETADSRVRPPDLASASWRSSADREAVRRLIVQGKPGHAMPGLAGKSPAPEIDSLVDFVFYLEILDRLKLAGFQSEMGQSAPELYFWDASETDGSLEELRGKVILLAFWGTTCAPCLEELPRLEALADRYDKKGLVVLSLCVDEKNARTAQDVAARVAPRLPVYVERDTRARERFRLQGIPTAILIDRDGRMLGRSSGARQWTGTEVEKLLVACLEARAPNH